jgi:hypothetical protein
MAFLGLIAKETGTAPDQRIGKLASKRTICRFLSMALQLSLVQ